MPAELERTLLLDKTAALAAEFGENEAKAFLRLVHALATDQGSDSISAEDITDGGDDYEMDVIAIDEQEDGRRAVLTIIAASRTPSHSTTELQRLASGLDYLFVQERAAYSRMPNRRLADKIGEFRALRTRIGAPNIRVKCFFATLGDTAVMATAFVQERDRIAGAFSNTGSTFSLEVLGAKELADLLNESDARGERVSDRIGIQYDRNRGSVIDQSLTGLSGLICTVTGAEIARLVAAHPRIFDRNLRRFLGERNAVNEEIMATCSNPEHSQLFWFLNNGITILCESFALTPDLDTPFLDVQNMHIINGCQTASALHAASIAGQLHANTRVMVRVFRASAPALAERVVVTTNTQTRITGRDMRSNDRIHVTLQRVFGERFNLLYERKPNQFAGRGRDDRARIVSNERIGQSYLSIVLRRPSDGGRRKYKLWDDDAAVVFNSNVFPEAYLLALRIRNACEEWQAGLDTDAEGDEILRRIQTNGLYHIARIAAYRWRRNDDWSDQEVLTRQIGELNADHGLVARLCPAAASDLKNLIEQEEEFSADVGGALKSGDFDRRIERLLRTPTPTGGQRVQR